MVYKEFANRISFLSPPGIPGSRQSVRDRCFKINKDSRVGWVEARNPTFFECHERLSLDFALFNPTISVVEEHTCYEKTENIS